MMDAENIQRFVNGQEPLFAAKASPRKVRIARRSHRSGRGGIVLVKSRGGSKLHKKRPTV